MICRARPILICLALLAPLFGGSSPHVVAQITTRPASPALQLYIRQESWYRQLDPLNASLKPASRFRRLQLGSPGGYQPSMVLVSRDGTTVAAISDSSTAGITTAKNITVRVIDAPSGRRLAQFHPSVPLWIMGISADGAQLFGWRATSSPNDKPEWDVLSTANGALLSRTDGFDSTMSGCCGSTLYDATSRRLYQMATPAQKAGATTPVTPLLAAYDLGTGREIGRLTLDGIEAGSSTDLSGGSNDPVFRMWTPGFALSPDGRQIAVLDGVSDRLLVIDAARMAVERSEVLSRPQGLLQRLAGALGLMPVPALAKEWLGVDLSMQFAPDGRHLYVTGREGKLGTDGKWTVDGLGLRLVDVASGQIVADALANRWVTEMAPSPDGTSLYADVTQPMGGGSAALDRLDAGTLKVGAERQFFDPPELFFLARGAPAPASWLGGWPMAGHDPQRTSRSPNSGPLEPHMLFQRQGLFPEIAGADGTIYAGSPKGLVALDENGKELWTAWECCGEGPPALAPNGMILATGLETRSRPAGQEDTEAIGLKRDGTVAWRIRPFGLLKGAVPLVSAANILYLPIVGPTEAEAAGLNIMSTDGKLLHRLPPLYNLAVAPDGTVFGLSDSGLSAFSADGHMLWRRMLRSQPYNAAGPLVGRSGTVFVGDGAMLDAFAATGGLLWHVRKSDGTLALAERADGVLLVAGRSWLDAYSSNGRHLWQAFMGRSGGRYRDERPSLIVDGDGTAYAGAGDGLVRAIAVDGQLLTVFDGGSGPRQTTPGLLLDAAGRLIVSGPDNIMRVYGS